MPLVRTVTPLQARPLQLQHRVIHTAQRQGLTFPPVQVDRMDMKGLLNMLSAVVLHLLNFPGTAVAGRPIQLRKLSTN